MGIICSRGGVSEEGSGKFRVNIWQRGCIVWRYTPGLLNSMSGGGLVVFLSALLCGSAHRQSCGRDAILRVRIMGGLIRGRTRLIASLRLVRRGLPGVDEGFAFGDGFFVEGDEMVVTLGEGLAQAFDNSFVGHKVADLEQGAEQDHVVDL